MSVAASSLHKGMLRIALPTIFMNLSIPLLGAVDTAVVGHLESILYVGAVSLGSLVFSVVAWGLSVVRMSVSGQTAQSHGRGDRTECGRILGRGLALGLALGLAVIALRGPIAAVAFALMEGTPAVEAEAGRYFAIRALAAPADLVGLIFTGWFYGVHHVWMPVALQVAANALNMGLDWVFAIQWDGRAAGVAWATVVAQYSALFANAAWFAWRFPDLWRGPFTRAIWVRDDLLRLLRMNGDLFIRNVSLLAALSYFMARSAGHGELVLAVNGILVHFRQVTAFGLDGFASGAQVLVGHAVGARAPGPLREVIRLALGWGLAVGLLFAAAFWLARDPVLHAFTSHAEVRAAALTFFLWVVIEPVVGNFAHILDGVYFGATASRTLRNAMLLAVFAFYFPVFWLLERAYGNHGMWAATVLLFVARGVFLGVPLWRALRRPEWRLA